MNEIVGAARRLADEVLFPSAAVTDAAGVVPLEHLDALAAAGFYGLSGPVSAGGLEADFPTVCAVVEVLSGGCLTTTFVWSQHIGAVLRVAGSETPGLRDEWLEPLCHGERRVGLAGPPAGLRARPDGDGWRFDGTGAVGERLGSHPRRQRGGPYGGRRAGVGARRRERVAHREATAARDRLERDRSRHVRRRAGAGGACDRDLVRRPSSTAAAPR